MITQLNQYGAQSVPELMVEYEVPAPYWDVNNDRVLSPIDALAVISLLNSLDGEGEGETTGHALAVPSSLTATQGASLPLIPRAAIPVHGQTELAAEASLADEQPTADQPAAAGPPTEAPSVQELQAWMVGVTNKPGLDLGTIEQDGDPEDLLDLLSADVADRWARYL